MKQQIFSLRETLMKTRSFAISAVSALSLLAASGAFAQDPWVGAMIGGSTGALIGHSMSGHDGAVIGGALGAIAGAAIVRHDSGMSTHYRYPAPPAVYYRPPVVFFNAPPVYRHDVDRAWSYRHAPRYEHHHRRQHSPRWEDRGNFGHP
jgi:hypothetical protein